MQCYIQSAFGVKWMKMNIKLVKGRHSFDVLCGILYCNGCQLSNRTFMFAFNWLNNEFYIYKRGFWTLYILSWLWMYWSNLCSPPSKLNRMKLLPAAIKRNSFCAFLQTFATFSFVQIGLNQFNGLLLLSNVSQLVWEDEGNKVLSLLSLSALTDQHLPIKSEIHLIIRAQYSLGLIAQSDAPLSSV